MDDHLLGTRLPPSSDAAPGVHVSLRDLVALKFRAKGFTFLPRQPVQSLLAGRHASRLRGRGLNFEEIRHYRPGDDVRQIDWKATLRLRKTQSRVYTEERERSVLLVVDQRITMFFGSEKNMKSVTAAEAAALAAWRVISQNDRLGGIVFNDTELSAIPARRSQSSVMRILNEVVRMNGELSHKKEIHPNAGMLNQALHGCERIAKHDCLVCIITDGHGNDDQTREILTRIARHNDLLFIFIHDPLEARLPDAGPLVFGDGAYQLEVDTSSRSLRDRFSDKFADERAKGRRFLIQRETPVIPLSTAEDVPKQLRQLLGTRRR